MITVEKNKPTIDVIIARQGVYKIARSAIEEALNELERDGFNEGSVLQCYETVDKYNKVIRDILA